MTITREQFLKLCRSLLDEMADAGLFKPKELLTIADFIETAAAGFDEKKVPE